MIKILESLNSSFLEKILNRNLTIPSDVEETVKQILKEIKEKGDEALFSYTKKFDRAEISEDNLRVKQDEIDAAEDLVDADFKEAINNAATNIKRFHKKQERESYFLESDDGVKLGKRYLPIEKAGIYIPGGTAPLVSSMLMNAIPAIIAGVPQIYAAIPPDANGNINPYFLYTAKIIGLKQIFKMGGAQAIAAFAYGTKSVPKVYKIVGPGNIYVNTAKRLVFGDVGIDSLAGPSEIVVIADETANPKYVASDMLSQAEHGSGFEASVLLTTSKELALEVKKQIEQIVPSLERAEYIKKSLTEYGAIIIANDIKECFHLANEIAPEHLEIQMQNSLNYINLIKNAGAVFIGDYSPEPVGDYFCGTNHVLPTNGTAKFSSSLGVDDFMKNISVVHYTKTALEANGSKIMKIAEIEGLTAHLNSVKVRLEEEN